MKPGLALSLTISVLLIGVASWYRFGTVKVSQPNLVAVELTEDDYKEITADFTGPKEVVVASSTEPFTSTDLIGHQLILDYVSLAGSGQVTDSDVLNLADRYVESLPTLNNPPTIAYADLKVVSDTKSNFQNYIDVLTIISNEYVSSINKIKAQAEGSDLESLNPSLYSLASALNITYTNTASKLKTIDVPGSLVPVHLQLVNIYLSNAAAIEAISKTDQDSTDAFVGLVLLDENLKKEKVVIDEINQILTSNGI